MTRVRPEQRPGAARTTPDSTADRGYFASVQVPVGPVPPEVVPALLGDRVRGFWETGGQWSAFGGAAAEIDARRLPAGGSPFAQVRRAAGALLDHRWVRAETADPLPARFYGGFAFHAEEPPRGESSAPFWTEFPAARFVLPRLTLVSGTHGGRLQVVDRCRPEEAPDRALDRLQGEAERVRRRLEQAASSAASASPARRVADSDPPPPSAIADPVGPEVWRRGVEAILEAIGNGAVTKVVLARPVDVTLGELSDGDAIFSRLRARNPRAHLFLLAFSPDSFLVGAAPELLGALRGDSFETMAVAGSTPRGPDPESDEWLGRQLLSSRKNLYEQRVVTEGLLERLEPFAAEPPRVGAPDLLQLSGIQHIISRITCRVRTGTHVLDLLEELHPSAAVCGSPRSEALRLLEAEEPIPRGWYAGPVGWFDALGDGQFAPALRTAVGSGPLLRLFAGAGIVDGSTARAEWDETRVKLQTMLKALGISRVP